MARPATRKAVGSSCVVHAVNRAEAATVQLHPTQACTKPQVAATSPAKQLAGALSSSRVIVRLHFRRLATFVGFVSKARLCGPCLASLILHEGAVGHRAHHRVQYAAVLSGGACDLKQWSWMSMLASYRLSALAGDL